MLFCIIYILVHAITHSEFSKDDVSGTRSFSILAGNDDNYKSLDEFEFPPDPISDCRVYCTLACGKIHIHCRLTMGKML